MDDPRIRFSPLVRQGLKFRQRLEEWKGRAAPSPFEWYRYDSFANLFYLQRLLRATGLSLREMAGERAVLDVGAADGALSFFLESLGHQVHAVDCAASNMNRMEGIRLLARRLESKVRIEDLDLDARFEFPGKYGLALCLGTLYHLKNPFYVLEELAKAARFAFVSTRVCRWSPDRKTYLGDIPAAYLVDADECNADATNYWDLFAAGFGAAGEARGVGSLRVGAVGGGRVGSGSRGSRRARVSAGKEPDVRRLKKPQLAAHPKPKTAVELLHRRLVRLTERAPLLD